MVRRLLVAVALAAALSGAAAEVRAAESYKGPTRINFDERLVKGQTAKAGSVYIYERQEIEIRSLVRERARLRDKIVRTVFDR